MRMQLAVVFGLLLFSSGIMIGAAAGGASQAQSLIGLTRDKYVIGIWPSYLKTVNKCENFRANTTPPLFRVWPEDVCEFCCEDKLTPHTMASYVHSEKNGRYLHPIPYYDVGIIDAFSPFWRSWLPDRISQKDITNLAYCEINDLKRFYVQRFWREAFAKQGLLYSGIPFVLLVEFLVLIAAIPQYILLPSTVPVRTTLRRFWGWESTWDLVHLTLVGINGSLLMEAVGHWDPCGWEAVLLYNSAVVYTYLALLSIVSAVVQQCALWTAERTRDRLKDRLQRMDTSATPQFDKVKRYKIDKEWQLQRISAQCAVSYLASLYCTFVTVYTRDEFVAWLLGIIIIAQVWSCVVGFAMLFKAFKLGKNCYLAVRYARQRDRQISPHSKSLCNVTSNI